MTFLGRVNKKSFVREVIPTFANNYNEQSIKFRKAFHFDLVDQNSEIIRVVAFDVACHKHYKNIKIGELLKIGNFAIRHADPDYNNLDFEYEIELTTNSIVRPVNYVSPDDVQYASLPDKNFQSFSAIESKEIGEYLGNCSNQCAGFIYIKFKIFNFVVDIKGVIREIGTVTQGTQKYMNKQWQRQSIKVSDGKVDNVIILWNANVENFCAKVGDQIQLYDCVIDAYNGVKRVSTNTITTYVTSS